MPIDLLFGHIGNNLVLQHPPVLFDHPGGGHIVCVTGHQHLLQPHLGCLLQDQRELQGSVALPPFAGTDVIANVPPLMLQGAAQPVPKPGCADDPIPVLTQPISRLRDEAGLQAVPRSRLLQSVHITRKIISRSGIHDLISAASFSDELPHQSQETVLIVDRGRHQAKVL
jgi:hypothetical protein